MKDDDEDDEGDFTEKSDRDYLLDLAERLRHIPVCYGTDDYDINRLTAMARSASTRSPDDPLPPLPPITDGGKL